jgi:hypothetical protein
MKHLTLILLVILAVFSFAVIPADYFIPLQVGNQLVYRSDDDIEGSGGWSSRTVFETIEGTDSLHGHLYYKYVGTEILDNDTTEHIFHVMWYREDNLGNILIGAVGMGDSRLLDSAMIYPMEYTWLFPERYEPGFGMRSYYYDYDCLDSTISNTLTISTNAGTYNNCVKMMSQRIDTLGDSLAWEEYVYYAEDVGEIMKERIFPDPHVNSLAQINFQIPIGIKNLPGDFRLDQNYPNPFNPLTTIEYHLPVDAYIEIGVYDVRGQEIAKLVNMNRFAGHHKLIWNAMDIASGIYLYTLKADNIVLDRKKMCILK